MVAQIIKNQIERIEYRDKKIFWVLFSIFAFFIVSYGFLLNGAMINAVSEQNIQKQIALSDSEVNSLEFQYLNIKNNITLDLAKSKGFVQVSADKFAVMNPDQKNISLSINEN